MGYPSSVQSFTTKVNNVDLYDAAHVNLLQTEVNAIEGGLLNGVAHDIKPIANDAHDLGSDTLRFKDLYLSGTLNAGAIDGGLLALIQVGVLAAVYPVGSLYFQTAIATNPATLLGFGTWEAYATGRVLVGIDAGQTEFDTLGETGGAKTHTLTEAEMPAHTHTQDAHAHGVTDPGHSHTHNITTIQGGSTLQNGPGFVDMPDTDETTSEQTGVTVDATTAVNQSTGGGGAHNNLQPYVVVHIWRRTA